MRRWLPIAVIVALGCAGGLAAVVVHVRRNVVPPGCRDARTLSQVAVRLPPGAKLERIRVLAGGPLAFQFICEADMGAMTVHYTSRLSDGGARQAVTVSVSPVLMWMRVK